MPKFDVTLAGEANLDMIFRGLPQDLPIEREILATDLSVLLGGSSAITAHNLAALGSRVGFISQVGNDIFSEMCLAELRGAGVDVSRAVPSRDALGTGVTVFLQHGEVRRAFTYEGAIGALRFEDLDLDYLASSRHFHLASFFLQQHLRPDAPKLLAAMRAAGLTTSLDTNDDPSNEWSDFIFEALRHVDIFLPNASEACRIAREDDPVRAATKLSQSVSTVVLKQGSRGAFALQEGRRYEVPPLPVSSVDTVGAGDSFNAGFLHAWSRGAAIEQCLEAGNLCGAMSTTAAGGTRAFKDPVLREQILTRLKAYGFDSQSPEILTT